jgi:hypothetical protein
MEAMLGISLYSYPYLKLTKHYVFFIIAYVFSNKIGAEGRTGSAWKREGWEGEMAQIMYAHMNK